MKAIGVAVAVALCGFALGACDTNEDWRTTRLADGAFDLGLPERAWTSDVWQVVRCTIPPENRDPVFADTDRRLSASVDDLIDAMRPVSDYFARWSVGRYRLEFIPGSDVVLGVTDTAQTCIDEALDESSARATGVVVIADALHRDDRAGGWTQPGRTCRDGKHSCAARHSRRAVYLGANDFWSLDDGTLSQEMVPLDLLEHEMGHSFGWPHSFRGAPGDYDSIIDVMSDSAAPRRARADRRHGPGVLAFHRLGAGWLDPERVTVVEPGAGSVRLSIEGASVESETEEPALIIVEVAEQVIVTIELVVAGGDNAHVARSGVAVHLVEWGASVCTGSNSFCGGVDRRVTLLGETPDGLLAVGESIEVRGVRIEVTALTAAEDDSVERAQSDGDAERMIARVTLRG